MLEASPMVRWCEMRCFSWDWRTRGWEWCENDLLLFFVRPERANLHRSIHLRLLDPLPSTRHKMARKFVICKAPPFLSDPLSWVFNSLNPSFTNVLLDIECAFEWKGQFGDEIHAQFWRNHAEGQAASRETRRLFHAANSPHASFGLVSTCNIACFSLHLLVR